MTCERFDQVVDGHRVSGFICSHTRRVRCAFCSSWSTKLCDGPPALGSRKKTCDAPLCGSCADHIDGQDLDYCPRCKAMRQRGGPPQPIGNLFQTAEVLARARAVAGRADVPAVTDHTNPPAAEEERHADAPGKAGPTHNPGPAESPAPPDPRPNSPEDVGFVPRQPKTHEPKKCASCQSPIYWAQTESGKSMPVDALPTPDGNIRLFDRRGSVLALVMKKHELEDFRRAAPGQSLRTSHFVTCPNAAQHRRSR